MISQQESVLFSDYTEIYPRCQHHLTKNSSEIPSGVSTKVRSESTDEGGEPNEPNEPDKPIQEVSWHDVPGVPQEPSQNVKAKTEVPIQNMSLNAIPGVSENEIPPNSPISDYAQINLKCITWKNEEQEPQADSVKHESSDIMMGTIPTQRKLQENSVIP